VENWIVFLTLDKMKMLRAAQIILLLLLWATLACAQGVTPTKGKDFWLGFMKNYEVEFGESLDLFIVSDQFTSGTVEVPGQGWSFSFTCQPNITTTVTIPNNVAEVYSSQVVESKGVHVMTEDTVAVFAISFNAYTADASKILPTPTLGIDYMVASYVGLSGYESELLIVATEDGSEIEITPSATTEQGDAAGVPFIINLEEGECYQVRAQSGGDLTGTRVTGTASNGDCRPFAVFSGTDCTNLPTGCIACDHIYDENFPIPLWGTEYYVTPFVFALSSSWGVTTPNYTYRIMASEDNTSVVIDGGAPFILNGGQFQEYTYEEDPHCITGSNPIAVIQYMEGISCGGNGDPAMVVLDDAAKKIDNITFSTVESTVITSHYINMVIDAADIGNVFLDGATIDPAIWIPFTACQDEVWCGFEISAGSHTLEAPGGGVSAYIYGNGEAESYAYSVGSFSATPPIIIDEAICSNDSVTLQISGNYYSPYWYNYTSTPEDTLALGYSYTLPIPIQNGIYVGVGNEFSSGCSEDFYFSVEVPEPPLLELTSSTTQICQYQSTQLNALVYPTSGVYFYDWTPQIGLNDPHLSNPIATPTETTTYTVTVTTPTACATNTASITIVVLDGGITKFEITPDDVLFCTGEQDALDVIVQQKVWGDDFDPGVSWGDWDQITGGVADDVCGSISGNALYFNGPSPRAATTNPINTTAGGSIFFSLKIANGVAPCDNAEIGDNVILSYSINGGANWIDIQTFLEAAYVNLNALEVAIPLAAQTAATQFRWRQVGTYASNQDNWILDNVYVGLEDQDTYSYTWSPTTGLSAANIPNPVISPSESITYSVSMTDSQTGCEYIDSVFVNVGQGFVLDMTPDTILCDIDGIQLQAVPDIDGEYDYLWTPSNSTINNVYSPAPIVTPTAPTTYAVTVTSAQGCSSTGNVSIIVGELLDLNVTASDVSICAGETIDLDANLVGNPPDITYQWSPSQWIANALVEQTTATPLQNITYTMVATHTPSGCQISDEVSISVLPAFTVSATVNDTTLCVPNGLQIGASASINGQLSWQWTPAALVANDNLPFTTMVSNTSADLVITATNSAGCGASDSVHVHLETETTDLGPDTGFCEDLNVTLESGWPADYTFLWSTNETTPEITLNQTGTYWVHVTSPTGCYSEDEVNVDVFTYPVFDLGPDTAYCFGASDTLQAPPGYNYVWSTGSTDMGIVVSNTSNYAVTVDNGYCFTTDAINVVFNALPVNPFNNNTEFCFGYPPYVLTLDALNPGCTYLWTTGENSSTINAPAAGLYAVQITSPFNCQGSFDVEVVEVCPGSMYIPNSFSPNNDGLNDYWFVYGENVEDYEVKIFNRWGEVFFESSDINEPWRGQRRDGNYYVEPGNYPYLVKFTLRDEKGNVSEEINYSGSVLVVR
jgi:gliding motility-associated-like protein